MIDNREYQGEKRRYKGEVERRYCFAYGNSLQMEGVHSEEEETCLQILQSCEIKSIPNQDRGHYDGKKVNVPLVFRKRKNDYRPISLTPMP